MQECATTPGRRALLSARTMKCLVTTTLKKIETMFVKQTTLSKPISFKFQRHRKYTAMILYVKPINQYQYQLIFNV